MSSERFRRRAARGATLTEVVVGLAIGSVLVAGVVAFSHFSSLSIVSLFSYASLQADNQKALDLMSLEIRRAQRVTAATASTLTLQDEDGIALSYTYDKKTRTLTRSKGTDTQVLLRECEPLAFATLGRNPTGTFEDLPAVTADQCKAVAVTWTCKREVLGGLSTTENSKSAVIVLRSPTP